MLSNRRGMGLGISHTKSFTRNRFDTRTVPHSHIPKMSVLNLTSVLLLAESVKKPINSDGIVSCAHS